MVRACRGTFCQILHIPLVGHIFVPFSSPYWIYNVIHASSPRYDVRRTLEFSAKGKMWRGSRLLRFWFRLRLVSCRVQCCLKDSWQLFVKASERFASLLRRVETTSSALSSLDETCLCQFTAFRGHPTSIFGKYLFGRRFRIFGPFDVKFLACLPLLGFSNI